MSRFGGARPPGEPERRELDDVAARLDDALHAVAGPDDAAMSTTRLLAGAQHGARRYRRRRVSLTALAVVAVAGAAALPSLTADVGGGPARPNPAAQSRTLTAATPSPSTLAGRGDRSSAVPSIPPPHPVDPGTVDPNVPRDLVGSVLVPAAAMPSAATLGFPARRMSETTSYLKVRTLTTSLCSDQGEPGEDLAVGGREADWIRTPADGASGVSTVVRAFDGNGAVTSMAYQRAAMPTCRYAGAFTPLSTTGLPGDEAVLGVAVDQPYRGYCYVVGAIRQGHVTLGIGLTLKGSRDDVVNAARALLERGNSQLLGSGLPQSLAR